jgi:predicted acylesterase/phospholipase RssA
MTNKEYSLALGWWAARGFIHIWVLKYLEERNIEIKEISGTSMWAIIGSLYAVWKTLDEIIQIASDINYLKLIDFDFKHGFLKWDKVQKLLDSIFWDIKIEELEIKLHIVATCIETWDREVFTSWRVSDAVRASLSLPGIFKPKQIGDNSYIDGWITTNLPIDVLKWKHIIWVSALKKLTWELSTKRKILWININKWFFNLNYQIIHRTILSMMKQNEERSLENVKWDFILIAPNFGKLDYYNFKQIEAFADIWYEETKNKIK